MNVSSQFEALGGAAFLIRSPVNLSDRLILELTNRLLLQSLIWSRNYSQMG